MILAGLCVVCDTILWLSTCFAFASPMLLSGFYEAYLDYTIINFLQEKTENFRLTLDMRARLLFVILCGNLVSPQFLNALFPTSRVSRVLYSLYALSRGLTRKFLNPQNLPSKAILIPDSEF
jgi:hypothetical protein